MKVFRKQRYSGRLLRNVYIGDQKFLYERYQKPIYITENGLSCHDVISLDGKVHDPNRIDFLGRYLHELKRAAIEVDIRGLFPVVIDG